MDAPLNAHTHTSAFLLVQRKFSKSIDFGIRSVGLAGKSRAAPILAQNMSESRPQQSTNRFSHLRMLEIVRKVGPNRQKSPEECRKKNALTHAPIPGSSHPIVSASECRSQELACMSGICLCPPPSPYNTTVKVDQDELAQRVRATHHQSYARPAA